MSTPVNCSKNKTITQIFNSKPEIIPEKISGKVKDEYSRLKKVVGLQMYKAEQVNDYKRFKYDYVGSQKLKKGIIQIEKDVSISTKDTSSKFYTTDIRFKVDFNRDGKKDEFSYRFGSEDGPEKYKLIIKDANQPYGPRSGPLGNRKIIDFDKYSKWIKLEKYAPTKKVDAMDNIRIFDIDQDSDLDVVVSFKNPATGKVEHLLFRNQICVN